MRICFETHATSLDNEAGLASGHFDVALAPIGGKQALELGTRYSEVHVVCCSDLQRCWRTAEIAFAGRPFPIVRDPRLRECDYGELTRRPASQIDALRTRYIDQPFPGGESYLQVVERVQSFLAELPAERDVLIIGHRATYYALEHLLAARDLRQVVLAPLQWKPGWVYRMKRD